MKRMAGVFKSPEHEKREEDKFIANFPGGSYNAHVARTRPGRDEFSRRVLTDGEDAERVWRLEVNRRAWEIKLDKLASLGDKRVVAEGPVKEPK